MITLDNLKSIYREAKPELIQIFLEPISQTLQRYDLNTLERCRMFLAQIGHESGQLRYTEELASGAAYEGRKDLGNTETGDGVKYKGRGLIQITGRSNYALCSLALDLPLLENPELLQSPLPAALSAGWFWSNNNLNSYCDKGDFYGLTKRINGGLNGIEDRVLLYKRACEAIK
jgi:putative chitinase